MYRGAWQATVHGAAKYQTRLSDCAHVRAHTRTHAHTRQRKKKKEIQLND